MSNASRNIIKKYIKIFIFLICIFVLLLLGFKLNDTHPIYIKQSALIKQFDKKEKLHKQYVEYRVYADSILEESRYNDNEVKAALIVYKKALDFAKTNHLDEDFDTLYEDIIFCYYYTGDFKTALSLINKKYEKQQKPWYVLELLGGYYAARDEYPKALKYYKEALLELDKAETSKNTRWERLVDKSSIESSISDITKAIQNNYFIDWN